MNRYASYLAVCAVRIEMFFRDQPLATGSAFFYEHDGRTFIVTNRHNLTGRHQVTGKPLDEKRGGIPNRLVLRVPLSEKSGTDVQFGRIVATLELNWEDKPDPWLEHPILGPHADVVAIDMHRFWPQLPRPFAHVNTIPNSASLVVGPASKVSVIGYPFGQAVGKHFPVWVSGSLASDLEFDADDKPAVFIDCRTNKGSSGSAVFAYVPGGLVQVEDNSTDQNPDIFMHYSHKDGSLWAMFGVAVHRFIGIYSGRINDRADIGLVWRPEVIEAVCAGRN